MSTKKQLLERISEAEIFRHYVPGFSPTRKKNYTSPFSESDKTPSLSIYRDGSIWKFKSQNTGHQGDVFQFVADIKNIDCKADFAKVIEAIETDLGNIPQVLETPPLEGLGEAANKSKNIKISFEPKLTKEFVDYFLQYKISETILNELNVCQVKYHEFIAATGKLCKFDYRKSNQLAVCYHAKLLNGHFPSPLGEGGQRPDEAYIKIYFPAIEGKQKKAFGFKNFTKQNIFGRWTDGPQNLFIAAGEKDCLALISNGFEAVSFQSENHIPDQQQIDLYKIKTVFLVYDNDAAGEASSKKICELTGWHNLKLPKGIKDTADFFREKTADDFTEIINRFIEIKEASNVPPLEGLREASKAVVGVVTNNPKTPPLEGLGEAADESEITNFTVFHATEQYLNRRYNIRYNTIKLELEISEIGKEVFKPLNENSLFVEMNKAGVKVGMDKLICILKSDYVPHFNPLIQYFKSLPKWDNKTDHIQKLCDFVECPSPELHHQFSVQFAKWMMSVNTTQTDPLSPF
jgi:hypothetical protein